MTCIAGIVEGGAVYIGGDSAATNSSSQQTIRADRKVFLVGECLFGCSSSFRMMQLLQHSLELPEIEQDMDIEKYMATVFIDAVRECLKKGGYAKKEEERERGGKFLVGFRGKLFCIDFDYQVAEALIGYDAVGTGDDIALGALFATKDRGMPPEERLDLALRAAEYHNSDVRAPFVIAHIEPPGSLNQLEEEKGI